MSNYQQNNNNKYVQSSQSSIPISNQQVKLLSTSYDPSKTNQQLQQAQQTHQYLNQPIQYNKSLNTSTKNSITPNNNTIINTQNILPHPSRSGSPQILTSNFGLPTHPNHPMNKQTITNTNSNINSNINSNTNNTNNILFIEKISDKIYNHFKLKYPVIIDASGFNKSTINSIISHSMKKEPLNEKSINKIIEIIDMKFKMTINSGNRQGEQLNTNSFTMDEESKISIDKYLENYTNKVTILSDNGNSSDKALEANLPKAMAPINELIKIDDPEPFSEKFPSRDRDKQIDIMKEELREYTYYIMVNSNDRNITKFPDPNEFVIDFAPAPSGDSPQTGYVDRSFHNIKKCYLLSVVVLDTSNVSGSSDFGGVSFPYLLLQLDELQNNYYGTNSFLSKSFGILTDYTIKGKYKYYGIVGDLSDDTVNKVYNPRINLTKLTTRLLLPDGTPFNFGTAMTNDTSNSCITFGISITTIQKNLSTTFINSA
jgi:hypothetical protein